MRNSITLRIARRVWSINTFRMVLVMERVGLDCAGFFSETFCGGVCFLEGRRDSRRDCLEGGLYCQYSLCIFGVR